MKGNFLIPIAFTASPQSANVRATAIGRCGIGAGTERALKRVAPGDEVDRRVVGKIERSALDLFGRHLRADASTGTRCCRYSCRTSRAGRGRRGNNIRARSFGGTADSARSCPGPQTVVGRARHHSRPPPSCAADDLFGADLALSVQRVRRVIGVARAAHSRRGRRVAMRSRSRAGSMASAAPLRPDSRRLRCWRHSPQDRSSRRGRCGRRDGPARPGAAFCTAFLRRSASRMSQTISVAPAGTLSSPSDRAPLGAQPPHQCLADEAGASGHENFHADFAVIGRRGGRLTGLPG